MCQADKIRPYGDSRISFKSAFLNGHTYGYLHSLPPTGTPKRGTIFLIHGFPDISMGWRYQIPMLTRLGLEVFAPDCLGYGRSDAPGAHKISAYTFKRIADDIATLCQQLDISSIILGGHDWGGAIVYRVAQFQRALVSALFVVCTPFLPPRTDFLPHRVLVDKHIPNFRYQLNFASGELEERIQSPNEIRNFLHALYGGRPSDGSGRSAFNAEGKINYELLPIMGKSRLLEDDEIDYYVQEYSRHGMNGPLNWYRNREATYIDDLDFFFGGDADCKTPKENTGIDQETLFIFATKDTALLEWMNRNMEQQFPNLTRGRTECGHWALWEKPDEVNKMVSDWLEQKVLTAVSGGQHSKL